MRHEAIYNLYPNVVSVDDGAGAFDSQGNQVTIDETAVAVEVTRLQAEYDAKAYQRSRATEYPSLADFADAYYWAQNGDDTKMTAYIEKCAAVKEKYPKA
jgi:hypothetical protein